LKQKAKVKRWKQKHEEKLAKRDAEETLKRQKMEYIQYELKKRMELTNANGVVPILIHGLPKMEYPKSILGHRMIIMRCACIQHKSNDTTPLMEPLASQLKVAVTKVKEFEDNRLRAIQLEQQKEKDKERQEILKKQHAWLDQACLDVMEYM